MLKLIVLSCVCSALGNKCVGTVCADDEAASLLQRSNDKQHQIEKVVANATEEIGGDCWKYWPGTYLGGCSRGCRKYSTLEAAKSGCAAERTCGGVTLAAGKYQLRSSTTAQTSPQKPPEDSWVITKNCRPSPTSTPTTEKIERCDRWKDKPGTYLGGCCLDCKKYFTLNAAKSGCDAEPTCGGVTKAGGKYQLRSSTTAKSSDNDEDSWVLNKNCPMDKDETDAPKDYKVCSTDVPTAPTSAPTSAKPFGCTNGCRKCYRSGYCKWNSCNEGFVMDGDYPTLTCKAIDYENVWNCTHRPDQSMSSEQAAATKLGKFVVNCGNCKITPDNCVTSPNFPCNYNSGPSGECRITAPAGKTLQTFGFELGDPEGDENDFHGPGKLIVNGWEFKGRRRANAAINTIKTGAGEIHWQPQNSKRKGWKLCLAPEIKYKCEPGMVQSSYDYVFTANHNCRDRCEHACSATPGCVAFDYTEKANKDACRGVRAQDNRKPRLGQNGDDRKYCTRVTDYIFGESGSDKCPAGTRAIDSEEECVRAAQESAKEFTKTVNLENRPKGCVWNWIPIEGGEVYFNKHETGKAMKRERVICSKAGSKPVGLPLLPKEEFKCCDVPSPCPDKGTNCFKYKLAMFMDKPSDACSTEVDAEACKKGVGSWVGGWEMANNRSTGGRTPCNDNCDYKETQCAGGWSRAKVTKCQPHEKGCVDGFRRVD